MFAHPAHQAVTYPECIERPLLVVAAVKQLDGAAHDRHTEHQALQQHREVRSAASLQQDQYMAERCAASQGATRDHHRGNYCQQQHGTIRLALRQASCRFHAVPRHKENGRVGSSPADQSWRRLGPGC